MKLGVLLLALAVAPALAGAGGAGDARGATYGQHGMALFGGSDGLYAAHLPMFHAPHNYQVLLQIRLADKAQDAALRRRLGGGAVLWTLAPEKFEIERLAPAAARPLHGFRGELVLGHFEQGGKTEYSGVQVVIEKVLLYRQLSPQLASSASARYLQAGSGTQRFWVKQLDSRPDFDHIVAVTVAPGTPVTPVTLAKDRLAAPPASVLERSLPGARVRGTVYYGTDDLR